MFVVCLTTLRLFLRNKGVYRVNLLHHTACHSLNQAILDSGDRRSLNQTTYSGVARILGRAGLKSIEQGQSRR